VEVFGVFIFAYLRNKFIFFIFFILLMTYIWIENIVIVLNMEKHAVLTSKELSLNLIQDHVPPPRIH